MTDQLSQYEETLPPDRDGHDYVSRSEWLMVMIALKSRWLMVGATLLVALLAWMALILSVQGLFDQQGAEGLGPGVSGLLAYLGLPETPLTASLAQLCLPQQTSEWGLIAYLRLVAMWFLMSIAMMLPSAAPMFKVYADIANVARRDNKPIVSGSILATGYLAVWLAFSIAAAGLQLGLSNLQPVQAFHIPVAGWVSGLILIIAGLYQFSSLKDACLTKCRNPFNVLFAKWSDRPAGIFKIGMEQGLYCLGCCWALMLVMLVVGTMNLAWMAFFTLFAVLEKSGAGRRISVVSGAILMLWGISLFVRQAAMMNIFS